MAALSPSRPRAPTAIERAAGIRADLERIAAETADLGTAADLGGVISLTDLLVSNLEGRDA